MKASKGFPALERTVVSVIAVLNDHRKGRRDVVGHVVEDFSLTQRILKLANSAMYAPFTCGAANISAALDVLGTDALLHVLLSTAMASDADLQDDETLSQTLLSAELARNVYGYRSEDASIAALMYKLGSLMLKRYLPKEAAAIEKKVAMGQSEDAAATEVLNLTLQQLGAKVAMRWKLPTQIVSIIDGTGDPNLVSIAKFSNSAAALIYAGKLDEVNSLIAELNVPGVDKSGITSLAQSKVDIVKSMSKATFKLSNEAVLEDLFAALSSERRESIDALAAAMFPPLAETLKSAHCLLFMLTKSGDFAIRYGVGKGIDELRSKLRIGKDYEPTAFHAAIKNNVDVSIADVSRLKASALPDGYRALLPNVTKFVILPITNSTVSGLLYCDWDCGESLPTAELNAVKKLRGLFLPYADRKFNRMKANMTWV
ncbi:MAG: HDOD domain-containing protein [Rhodoferax sp.]|nr:HDOD domain-containing protein [Rhodoferax sp.]